AGRAAGRAAGGSTGPWGVSFRDRGMAWLVSGCLGQGGDLGLGGGDGVCPGPGRGDPEPPPPPPAAAGEPGGGVQDLVARVLGSAFARSPSRARWRSQASRVAAISDAASHAVWIVRDSEGND